MVRVLYGVCGERRGHCTRSKIVLEYLVERGDDVKVLTDGDGASHFQDVFPYDEIVGWSGVYQTQRLNKERTFRD